MSNLFNCSRLFFLHTGYFACSGGVDRVLISSD